MVFRGTQLRPVSNLTKRRSLSSYNYFTLLRDLCIVNTKQRASLGPRAFMKVCIFMKLYPWKLLCCISLIVLNYTLKGIYLHMLYITGKTPSLKYYALCIKRYHSTDFSFMWRGNKKWCSVRGFMLADNSGSRGLLGGKTNPATFRFCKGINGDRDYDHCANLEGMYF